MNVIYELESEMRLTGLSHKHIKYNDSFKIIPPMWDLVTHDQIQTFVKHQDDKGIMGICAEFSTDDFTYMIGIDTTQDLGYYVINVPSYGWLKFSGIGNLPEGIQEIWKKIPDWLDEHIEYTRIDAPEIEVYDPNKTHDDSMYFEVWIAAEKKEEK